MMTKIDSSNKYFWNTKDSLGTGATAQVFAGYSKVTGNYSNDDFVTL